LLKRLIVPLILSFFIAANLALAADGTRDSSQLVIMGWVENVYVTDIDAKLKAKLDTGATTSSMRAEVLKILPPQEGGKRRRVVFQLTDADGKTSTLERKIVRMVRIKSRSGGAFYRRPVVEMEFCVAGHLVQDDVNLASREDFLYPLLIGRNMMRKAGIVVDPSRTFTGQARCAVPDGNVEE
jgi:hypothetical protein